MKPHALVAAAAASLLSTLVLSTPAQAQGKEKCYGIAQAGQNDCANLSGSHGCAGQTQVSLAADDWKYVAQGSCASLKGMGEAQAKEKIKKDGAGKKS